MPPYFTNDAVTLGILLIILASIFYTASLDNPRWKKFYTYVPSLLLCYFVPALFHWPLGLIAPHWYDPSISDALTSNGLSLPADFSNYSYEAIQKFIQERGFELKNL